MVITIGIDPGITGAIAAVQDGHKLIYYTDMPVLQEKSGSKVSKTVSGTGVWQAFRDIMDISPAGSVFHVCVEKTSAMPGQGVASMYSMGHSRGVVEGVVGALRLPLHRVRPAIWKKAMGFTSDKEVIRSEMLLRFPGAELHRKKDADRAEAIAMALYLHKEIYA